MSLSTFRHGEALNAASALESGIGLDELDRLRLALINALERIHVLERRLDDVSQRCSVVEYSLERHV